jgi:hypothetical protein
VNDFVEECRSEWRRLGVPDQVAAEMAADLAADLAEAEAEGVSPEEVLGSGAFDPRSFAAAWAAERGVIGHSPPRTGARSRPSLLAAAIGTVAVALAIVGAVLLIADSSSVSGTLALPASDASTAAIWVRPDTGPLEVIRAPDGRAFVLPPTRETRAVPVRPLVAVDADHSGADGRTVGAVLLVVGLAGVVISALFVLWFGPGRGRTTAKAV